MSWLARRLPLVLLSAALVIVTAALVLQVLQWPDPLHVTGSVLVACYLAWLLVESYTTVQSSKSSETVTDRGTVHVYATARLLTLSAALLVPDDWGSYRPWMAAVLVVFVGAVLLRLWAIRTLGRFYSHRVRMVGDHELVQDGPYRFLRHPAYTGMALAHVAFVSFFLNPFSAGALVVFLLPTLVVRILVEERMLFQLAGYAEFAAGRKRLIPFVW
jgi:protein-S-isoprenylcysteine O-methyltransferase Ste14